MTQAQLTVFARITHAVVTTSAVVALWAALGFTLLALVPSNAFGQDQPCGKGGTARVADGTLVTRTDIEAAAFPARIGKDGYWWTCGETQFVPPASPPKDCIPQTLGFREWTVGEHTCTTWLKSATSATNPARDRVIQHGRIDFWRQWTGSHRGQLIERCIDGTRVVIGSSCEPVTHCDTKWTDRDRGYTYDARSARVPVGAFVSAVAPNGKAIKLQCIAGDFQRVR
jgi:hypothetical protein